MTMLYKWLVDSRPRFSAQGGKFSRVAGNFITYKQERRYVKFLNEIMKDRRKTV